MVIFVFFFFKQKTAYELRISDWSSDVCSSDLLSVSQATVPEGVRPGQPFALIANNQRVMVTCPPNVRPGQKIRFQLPITLDENQVQSYKVSYDKDGWMRDRKSTRLNSSH